MPSPSTGTTRGALAWWALFALLCFLMMVMGLEMVLHFRGSAIDGPFQLYNSLRRILAGQRGGVDFQFFHGLAIPYLHYLQFRLLGSSFVASEMTRQLTSVLLYPITVVVFLRFFLKDWTRVAAWSAIVMAASIGLRLTSVLIAVNSLLGIRSTIPILVPVVLCLPINRIARAVLTGIALGLALVLGTEQGMAAIAGLGIASAVLVWTRRDRVANLLENGAAIAMGVLTAVLILVVIGGVDGMRQALAYNFRLVPMDQYWYFGAPPNLFFAGWGDVPRLLKLIPRVPITLLVGAAFAVFSMRRLQRAASRSEEREQFAFTALALYGLVSCASLLGTYVHLYIQPLLRVLLLVGAVYADRYLSARDQRVGRASLLGVGRSTVAAAAVVLVLMFGIVPSLIGTIGKTAPHFIRTHIINAQGAEYTDIWPETMATGQAILDSHRNADGTPPSLWSTYSGLLEANNGVFHPSFDYVIHALGPANRDRYLAEFRRVKPRLVQTVLPTYTQYEPWIEATSWDFYADVLANYRVVGRTPWSLFWERQPSPSAGPQQVWSAEIPRGATSVTLPAAPGSQGVVLLQAELFYTVKNPLHVLPIIGTLPRYLVSIQNAAHQQPTTLNPYVASSRIPIVAFRGKAPTLSWGTFSLLPAASIEVTRVTLSFVPLTEPNLPWLENLYMRQAGRAPD